MPRLRSRGGTRMPRAGDDTRCPAMLISPDVGCSSPATQRRVVVLPQPDGPSRTTISPAATAKLTSSTAGRPVPNALRRRSTRNSADMGGPLARRPTLLAITVDLVPILHPGGMEFLVLLEIRDPRLPPLGVRAL